MLFSRKMNHFTDKCTFVIDFCSFSLFPLVTAFLMSNKIVIILQDNKISKVDSILDWIVNIHKDNTLGYLGTKRHLIVHLCSLFWSGLVGFKQLLINVYATTLIFLLPGLPTFSFQACFLITLLALRSRILLEAETNAIITARYFKHMFIITVLHRAHLKRTNWFYSTN